VSGDDDEAKLPPAAGSVVRNQLTQGRRLASDLTNAGAALLAGRPVVAGPLSGGETLTVTDPLLRLRVLAALTSNAALNSARSIASASDANVGRLITLQIVFGAAGVLMTLLLGWALVATTRRQTAHFRSLVTSSSDLVFVFGGGECRYVSQSLAEMLGCEPSGILGQKISSFVHHEDRSAFASAHQHGKQAEVVFRIKNRFDEWRHLEAHVTDLRSDRRIRGVVLNARDVTERVELEEQLTRQAFHDVLTGLPNRALFRDRLEQALARCDRSLDVFSLLLIDLDGFKQVNDSLGHQAGDQLLQEVARRFDELARTTDTLARLGGDEFALLVSGATEPAALAVASRLHAGLADPIVIAGRDLAFGASIGIAVHRGGGGDGDELVRHADVAMYAAKEAGRGRSEVFHDDMDRELGEMLGLEHELRLGIQRREFSIHYQPEVALDGASVVGVEALLRWHSPARGLVPPDVFIPVAEATGLIMPLGEFVLREACEETARWRRDGVLTEPFNTWVNLSGKQLSSGGIDDLVNRILEHTGLPAQFLGLEVTESAIVVEGSAGVRAQNELQRLRDKGVKIAIDDFGTGFSALGQLRRFPIDVIKVDRSFIHGIETDVRDAAITANVVNLAHALGLVAIAEGIETDGQLASVREYGCDQAQGYLFGRPVPADEIRAVLAATRDGSPLLPHTEKQFETGPLAATPLIRTGTTPLR
jgi:diguanylate cyclase (GGDEF)-like protein/PAS domain S-box-containing protein